MEKKFRLKKEARQFFKNDEAERTKTFSQWEKDGYRSELLEEVPAIYVEYGVQGGSPASKMLCGFDQKKGAHFQFTIYAQDMTYKEYMEKDIPKMMDVIQRAINTFLTGRG